MLEMLTAGAIFADDYRVIGSLAQGGMGTVYLVQQLSTGNERALKLMLPQIAKLAKWRERFDNEARVSSRIASEHVVQVVAAGVDRATEQPYIVMEFLRGQDLAEVLVRMGVLPPTAIGEIFAQLGHALEAAHAAGVVHRDLKPENIFLAAPRSVGSPFMVKVLDFGIAKLVAEASRHTTIPIGTPKWMAPEQTARDSRVGPATDVWPLALLAFRMLTGRVYWLSATDEDGDQQVLLREILVDPIAPASVRAASYGVVDLLPDGFDRWFASCLQRRPEERQSAAGVVCRELAELLGRVTPAPSPAPPLIDPVWRTPTPAPVSPQPRRDPSDAAPARTGEPPAMFVPHGGTIDAGPLSFPEATPLHSLPDRSASPAVLPPPPPRSKSPRRPSRFAAIAAGVGVAALAVGLALVIPSVRRASAERMCKEMAASATPTNGADVAEACARSCEDSDKEGCFLQGTLVHRLRIGKEPEAVMTKAFARACELADLRGCRAGAAQLEPVNPSAAAERYAVTCNKGDAPSCTSLGALLEVGRPGRGKSGSELPRDPLRAASHYDKACGAGDALGCAYKAFMIDEGRGLARDGAVATKLAAQARDGLAAACERGGSRECLALSVIVGKDKATEAHAAQLEQKACDAGEARACSNLGVRHLLGVGVFKDVKRGSKLVRDACQTGEAVACTNAGMLAAHTAFTVRHGVGGVAALKLACATRFVVGCSGWGAEIAPAAELDPDAKGAVELSQRGCELGDTLGCVNVGAFHQRGFGTPVDREKASALFRSACDNGDAGGCGELATMYLHGRGVTKDKARARQLMRQACTWGERDACVIVAEMDIDGDAGPKNPAAGLAALKEQCEQGNAAMACAALGSRMVQGKDATKDVTGGVKALTDACSGARDHSYPDACQVLGWVHEQGLAGKVDMAQAMAQYRNACEAQSAEGCNSLAFRLAMGGVGVTKSPAEARTLAETACNLRDSACNVLGFFHQFGKAGLVADGKEAVRHYQRACDDGATYACTSVGYVYLVGAPGVTRDRSEAATRIKRACADGDEEGCKLAKRHAL